MTANIINGKALAKEIILNLKEKIEITNIKPGLAVVLVGDDPASGIYVKRKTRSCEKAGIVPYDYKLPFQTTQEELLNIIEKLNINKEIDGILVQLPLPPHIDQNIIIEYINPKKDVDGFHPVNLGRLMWNNQFLVPCTPLGIMEILKRTTMNLVGADVLIVGMSVIVGKPLVYMLLNEECTITTAHKMTKNLPDLISRSDIVISAVGKPEFIKGDWIKYGAIVIDVGISRIGKRIYGDVEFSEAVKRVSAITPVPGGVGPLTVAMLMKNTYKASSWRR
jgi:methylenetetrahydrofolate dehydrogenase (NADP+)/methenyltetrahydrofolate cyclohydrolase